MDTQIILIRHGQSQWNADSVTDRFNGRTDVQLSEEGFKQVELLAEFLTRFEIASVFSSPLSRAISTAEAVAGPHNVGVRSIPELIEIDFGMWEGLTLAEISRAYPVEFEEWTTDPAVSKSHGGESGYEVASRVLPFLGALAKSHVGETIAVVAHKVVNRIVLCHWLGVPIREYRKLMPQRVGSLNIVRAKFTRAVWVESIDDLSYMKLEL